MARSSVSNIVRRILARLEYAEGHEVNPHLQDDFRIAWITVLSASAGVREPHVAGTYAVLGVHPDKVWPAIVERRRALLGRHYEEFFGEKFPPASSPRKPVQSVRLPRQKNDGRNTA